MRLLISALTTFTAVSTLALTGCVVPLPAPVPAPEANRFADTAPTAQNPEHVGLWTAMHGPDITTLRIDQDGRGVACASQAGIDSVRTFKVAGTTLNYQDGTQMPLVFSADAITGVMPSAGASGLRFERDTGLSNASAYCRERLQKPYL